MKGISRPTPLWTTVESIAATIGIAVAATVVVVNLPIRVTTASMVPGIFVMAAVGFAATRVARQLGLSPWVASFPALILVPALPWASLHVLLMPEPFSLPVAFLTGVTVTAAAAGRRLSFRRISGVTAGCALILAGTVTSAGAWSVDEPHHQTSAMKRGNGIIVDKDTHAFLLQQGVIILKNDGNTRISDFLLSEDPTAPHQHDPKSGKVTTQTETYLWRMQRAARDADRVNKPTMPDHFFNWLTHSGKGLIAGPSAATYAEQQHDQAIAYWKNGDKAKAMYHLGAATHLVDDGCTPPHATFLVPNHRDYENWIVGHQSQLKATSGGIYQDQFRVRSGHGGPKWSSSHTRGWVDECAHRAADQITNTIQPPSENPLLNENAANETTDHFRQTQQMTAGYLKFFFDEVGGP